jgi:hypothetical protein
MPGKLLLQNLKHLITVFLLPLGLLGVEAQDILLAHLAVADNHLFGVQLVFDRHVASSFGHHVAFDFSNTCHAICQQEFAAGSAKLCAIVF